MFQRTIPGFEPSPESFAISAEALQNVADWLESAGICGQENLDLFTAIGTGLAAQQISNDPLRGRQPVPGTIPQRRIPWRWRVVGGLIA